MCVGCTLKTCLTLEFKIKLEMISINQVIVLKIKQIKKKQVLI